MRTRLIKKSVRSLTAYAPGEQPQGAAEIIKLNTNENPYPPSPRVAESLAKFKADSLRLYPDPECSQLRAAIARSHGCGIQQVFIGNGSDEILALATRAFVEDSGSIGFFVPSYSLYPVLADIRAVEKRPVRLGSEFEWRMPADYSASLFFLTNPNAPTGTLFPKGKVEPFCRRAKGVVVIDEAYVAFAREHCAELALNMNNVLAVRTLSKSHSLAGLRVGYAIGPEPLIHALFKVKDSYNIGRLAQAAALAAMQDRKALADNVRRVKQTRQRCAKSLSELGFKVYPSEANFLWVLPPRIGAKALYLLLRERNILVRHFDGAFTKRFLRISVGTDKQMDAFLAAVQRLIEAPELRTPSKRRK